MRTALKLLAPYLSVAVFWLGAKNGILALAGYHLQVLIWVLVDRARPKFGRGGKWFLALPMVGAGPLLYFLLPVITRVDLTEWLRDYHLSGWTLLLLVPYFGILHPVIEQVHWGPLRDQTKFSHLFFAGYHMLVLVSLLDWQWLVLCAVLLAGASVAWQYLTFRNGGIGLSAASHICADLGVIVATWILTSGDRTAF